MNKILLASFLMILGAPALHATVEETELAAKLTVDATEFLDQLLGPGRAKVLITVQAERTEVRSQSEVTTPIYKPPEAKKPASSWALPGYTKMMTQKEEPPEDLSQKIQFYQKDQEQSLRLGGLVIKSLNVSVVLDATLAETQVNTVRRLLPDLLRMDGQRGDVLTVLRAPLMPMWQRAFLSTEGIRSVVFFGGGAILIIGLVFWLSVTAYVIALRSVRTFVSELAARRAAGPMPPPFAPGGPPALGAPAEVMPGGIPGLAEPLGMAGLESGLPAPALLGRRFDFLSAKPPEELAELLGKETPDDLAILFGHLADANPDLATKVFSALPIALQGEVSQALVHLTTADPERLAMLESRVKTMVEFGVRGPERLGRILSRLPAQEREEILGDIMSRDAAGAEKVESSLFPFERIGELQPAELRRLLTAVPYAQWGVALRGAGRDLLDPILAQLPAGPRALVRDALETPQPREKVLEARSKILSQVYSLAARGQISLGREGSAPEVI